MSGSNVIRSAGGNKRVLAIRSGGGVRLGGMRPDLDPASLGPADFVYLENIRRVGGNIVSRGGQAEFVELGGEPLGMIDFNVEQASGLLFLSNGTGLYSFDSNLLPILQPWIRGSDAIYRTTKVNITAADNSGAFSGYVFGNGGEGATPTPAATFSRFPVTQPGNGISADEVSDLPIATILTMPDFDGYTLSSIDCYVQAGPYLFIGATGYNGGDGCSCILKWDGTTLTRELLVERTGSVDEFFTGCVQFRDTAVFFGPDDASSPALWIRAEDGTWTKVATAGLARSQGMVSFQDALYFLDGSDDVYSFDGATVTTIAPATTGVDGGAACHVMSLATDGHTLWYFWIFTDGAPLVAAALGSFDGSTWTPTAYDFIADYPDLRNVDEKPIAFYRGALHLAANEDDGGTALPTAIYRSYGLDIGTTWEKIELPISTEDPGVAKNLEVH